MLTLATAGAAFSVLAVSEAVVCWLLFRGKVGTALMLVACMILLGASWCI